MAARTQSYTAPSKGAAPTRGRSTIRATLAILLGIVAVVVIPLAIEATRTMTERVLLDAAWAIPVAAIAAVGALMLGRDARGGSRLLLAARVLAVTGICLALSSAIAVGIYEFLVWKESN